MVQANGHGSAKASFTSVCKVDQQTKRYSVPHKKQKKNEIWTEQICKELFIKAVACAETRFTTQSRNTKKVVAKTIRNCFHINHFVKMNK